MNIFLEPEIEEGNIEYKRFLKNDEARIEEYASQMKWRIGEGNGEALYYLGIEDDGKFYNWNEKEKKQTLQVLKKIINKSNLRIVKIDKMIYIEDKTGKENNYYKVLIREKDKIFSEKRILLLGDTGVGKSTFLSNLILSKLDDKNKEARMYLLNHKHEIIQKKTSSFNYLYTIYNNTKWIFIEAPGDDKYIKTRNKIILSFGSTIDSCLIIEKEEWKWKEYYVEYLKKVGIPYININLYETKIMKWPNYNTKILIDKNDFFTNLLSLVNTKSMSLNNSNKTEFIILQSFINNDFGVILTGILKKGEFNINKNYYLHINQIHNVKIKSIHLDGKPYDKIKGPKTISICIDNIEIKDYIGIISNNILPKIIEIPEINKKQLIYKDNRIFNLESFKKYYQTNDKVFLLN
jgi:GTPase